MRTSCIGSLLLLTCACPPKLSAQPVTQPVIDSIRGTVHANSPFPPGGFLLLDGSGFASRELHSLVSPYPTKLAGVSVTANGISCPIVSVSPTLVTILLPLALAAAESPYASLILTNENGSTEPRPYTSGLMPVILTADRERNGPAVVFDEALTPLVEVTAGQTVVLPVMGLGPTDPPAPDGASGPVTEPFPVVVHPVRVFFGDAEAQVLSATLAPGQVGLCHVRVVIPDGGDGSVTVIADNYERHSAKLPVPPPPPNVSNVTAAIESLFGPGPLTAATWSPIFAAAKFTVNLTVLPGARPFQIELKGPVGGVTIQVNPPADNWTAFATVPTQATRFGDFSRANLTVWDFVGGNPFPGNQVPTARIPPHYIAAFQSLPVPNSASLDGPVTLANSTGVIPPDGVIALNFATGTWIPISTSPDARASGVYSPIFTLFVDGSQFARTKIDLPLMP